MKKLLVFLSLLFVFVGFSEGIQAETPDYDKTGFYEVVSSVDAVIVDVFIINIDAAVGINLLSR